MIDRNGWGIYKGPERMAPAESPAHNITVEYADREPLVWFCNNKGKWRREAAMVLRRWLRHENESRPIRVTIKALESDRTAQVVEGEQLDRWIAYASTPLPSEERHVPTPPTPEDVQNEASRLFHSGRYEPQQRLEVFIDGQALEVLARHPMRGEDT